MISRFFSFLLAMALLAGATGLATAQDASPAAGPSPAAQVQIGETRTTETVPAPAPSTTWTVFGMDSTAGVMIGIVLMLVFILAIVAVSRNERTTVA
jgi:hypothetical protein